MIGSKFNKMWLNLDGLVDTKSFIDLSEEICLGIAQSQPHICCLLYTSPSPRDRTRSRMPSSA